MYDAEWLQDAITTGKEYFAENPVKFEAYIEANGFSPEHENAIREAVK